MLAQNWSQTLGGKRDRILHGETVPAKGLEGSKMQLDATGWVSGACRVVCQVRAGVRCSGMLLSSDIPAFGCGSLRLLMRKIVHTRARSRTVRSIRRSRSRIGQHFIRQSAEIRHGGSCFDARFLNPRLQAFVMYSHPESRDSGAVKLQAPR